VNARLNHPRREALQRLGPLATALPAFGPPRFHLATQGQASYKASVGSARGCSNNGNSAPPLMLERFDSFDSR